MNSTFDLSFLKFSNQINNLTIDHANGTGSIILSNAIDVLGTMSLNAASVTVAANLEASGALSFGGSVNVTNSVTISANGLSASAINLNANTLTISEVGTGTLSGVISGTGGLTKTGRGDSPCQVRTPTKGQPRSWGARYR